MEKKNDIHVNINCFEKKKKDAHALMYQSIYTDSCFIMNMSSCNILHQVLSNKTKLTGRQSLET